MPERTWVMLLVTGVFVSLTQQLQNDGAILECAILSAVEFQRSG
jgi:hypothetical protein